MNCQGDGTVWIGGGGFGGVCGGGAQDRDVAYPDERIACERVDEVVARELGTMVESLNAHGRTKGAGVAKLAAIELSCRLSGLTQREIGRHYGGISSQAVSLARKRAKSLVSADELARLVATILECSPSSAC